MFLYSKRLINKQKNLWGHLQNQLRQIKIQEKTFE
jgi:hypothetical protein